MGGKPAAHVSLGRSGVRTDAPYTISVSSSTVSAGAGLAREVLEMGLDLDVHRFEVSGPELEHLGAQRSFVLTPT
jgi:hypothetical protein